METDAERGSEMHPAVALAFGQIEAVLADIHAIAPDKRVAFAGRLKALQRNGLPSGGRSGRGKAASFSYSQFLEFAIALELMQAGISPSPAAQIVRVNWPIFRHSIAYATTKMADAYAKEPRLPATLNLCWLIQVRDFRDLSRPCFRDPLSMRAVEAVNSEVLANAYSRPSYAPKAGNTHAKLILDGASLIWATIEVVTRFGYATSSAIVSEILDPTDMPCGLSASTPPWALEASKYFDDLEDSRWLERRAQDFINEAPKALVDNFHYFARSQNLDPKDLLFAPKLELFGAWGLIDVEEESGYILTRLGGAVANQLIRGGRANVDPQA